MRSESYEIAPSLQDLPDLENRRLARTGSNLFSPVRSISIASDDLGTQQARSLNPLIECLTALQHSANLPRRRRRKLFSPNAAQ
jgi:hypothetical protein